MEHSHQHHCSFRFKQFGLTDSNCGMKIGTDGVLLGAWVQVPDSGCAVADIGAGCGLIAMMIAQRCPGARRIDAVEISEEAFKDLRDNVDAWIGASMVSPILSSFSEVGQKYDLIVSNPPFFTENERSPEISRAEARHAGALSPETLIEYAATHLNPDGSLAMVLPARDFDSVNFKAAVRGMSPVRVAYVSTREGKSPSRVMIQFMFGVNACETEQIVIADKTGNFTRKYVDLTHDFYLNL